MNEYEFRNGPATPPPATPQMAILTRAIKRIAHARDTKTDRPLLKWELKEIARAACNECGIGWKP